MLPRHHSHDLYQYYVYSKYKDYSELSNFGFAVESDEAPTAALLISAHHFFRSHS